MNSKTLVAIFLAVLSVSCKSETKQIESKTNTEKPNVLIIFPDQLRRYSAGYWSKAPYNEHVIGKPDPVITPNIDKLAEKGVVFTQAISNYPLCSPYRGMLLSGMYPEQNGIWNNCRKDRTDGLKDEVKTITDLFYNEGYNTSYFGKCHYIQNEPFFDEQGNYVGTTEAPGGHFVNPYDTYVPPGPSRHSVEYFYQALKDEHYNPHIFSNDPNTIAGKKDGEIHLPKVYSAKNEAEKIIDYLQNKNAQRDANKPFCMIWSLNPPHNPWDDASTDMDMLKAHYSIDKFPEIDRNLIVRENASVEVAKYARNYFAAVSSIDKYIGQVLDELKIMELLDNTIVIFSSDHGEMLGSHGLEGKNVIEMEAMAIPFIVHWPKGLKANINDALLSAPDVLPTIMGLAGFETKIPKEVEGINFAPLLKNPETTTVKKPEAVLLMLNNSRGVLTNQYTLCIEEAKNSNDETVEPFIYDNVNDPYQLHKINLKDAPKVSKTLLTQLAKLLQQTNDPWFQQKRYKDLIPYQTKQRN